jgi:fatty-acyl-CoA synthase
MEVIRKTIGRLMDEMAGEFPHHEALVHAEAGVRYSYALLSWEVNRVAGGLLSLGMRKGDRAALWAPNTPEWVISQLALFKIGALMVPIDPGAAREDLHFILGESECKALIMAGGPALDEHTDMVLYERDSLPSLQHIIVVSERLLPDMIPWTDLTAMGDEAGPEGLKEAAKGSVPEDPAAIMYTSGTTGKPKGVVLDHLGLVNKSFHSVERQGLTRQDRLSLFFPLYHMFGNTCIALAGLLKGATLVMPCQAFDASKVLQALHAEACTAIYGSPSMLIALLDHPDFNKTLWKTVTKGTIGGAPCPMELMKRLVEDLGISDITVAYGITEASSWITMTDPADPLELRVSTIGKPLACNEVKIVDPLTGENLETHRQGELCTRGFLMKGYFKMPAATAAAIDRDGWFHTGDLGEMDGPGYVKITGRLKDVIVREGFEIYPVEVEEVLYRLPGISEAHVFGFPHPEKGQEMAAWVKPKEGTQVSLETIETHLAEHLREEKRPRFLKIVSSFPMTRSGKVQKFRLAEMAQKEYL